MDRLGVLASVPWFGRGGLSVRFVYGATDGVDGSRVFKTSGAIFLPTGDAPAGGWPIVAWAHGTVGIADRCAPSVNPRSSRDAEYLSNWQASKDGSASAYFRLSGGI
jgi:hypothetical protein